MVYISYELTGIDNVTRNTSIHTLHFIGIYPWTNMPTTLHTYVSLHHCYSVNIDGTLLHAYDKKKMLLLFNMLLPHMCQQPICPSHATYMPYRQITLYVLIGEIWQYVCHIRSHLCIKGQLHCFRVMRHQNTQSYTQRKDRVQSAVLQKVPGKAGAFVKVLERSLPFSGSSRRAEENRYSV